MHATRGSDVNNVSPLEIGSRFRIHWIAVLFPGPPLVTIVPGTSIISKDLEYTTQILYRVVTIAERMNPHSSTQVGRILNPSSIPSSWPTGSPAQSTRVSPDHTVQ